MLHPNFFKNNLIYIFIGREKGVNIIEEHDKQLLYLMF